ncbi:phytoene desaturase family protein [Jiulongibacter sp. NS-SX5]|uniref:phytoene desaturase family protein n=1 Tax=Jiulongibacter sp. NS-SX5 TaxID=3463854 RepID=UPI004057FB17
MKTTYDIIIVGSGHNALVAACYLAKENYSVLVLEKSDYLGGATTSQKTFPDYDAKLSRYSYLISLLPLRIIKDLELDLELFSRDTASYTPYIKDDEIRGLLISNQSETISKKSILELGLGEQEWVGYCKLQERCLAFAHIIWDSLLEPLKSKNEWKSTFAEQNEQELREDFCEKPIGQFIDKYLKSDILKGVILTDARIGVQTSAYDPSLLQNRTFIYHIIGNKTGEWKVPKGGMGALVEQLITKAKSLDVSFKTESEVIDVTRKKSHYMVSTADQSYQCQKLLFNAAPNLLNKLLPNYRLNISEGTAFKINILLKKLPKLKDKRVSPEDAFCGTLHINQNFEQQELAHQQSIGGKLPKNFPFEMYCHTLTDDSILSKELSHKGFHTITAFGMDTPYSIFKEDNEKAKSQVLKLFYEGINPYLEKPIQESIALDSSGNLCIECKSALDLERELGLPLGNIFHNDLSWFYAENGDLEGKLGVETEDPNIVLCGSAALRGGAVSGIPGYLAAKYIRNKKG